MVPIPYRTPDTCDANEYFRTTNLSCALCGATQTPRSDRLACTCPRGHHLVYSTGLCEKCSEQQVTSEDGLYCITCLLNQSCTDTEGLASCSIKSNRYVYVDQFDGPNVMRSCQQCPPGTWADSSQHWCVPCITDNCNAVACTSVACSTIAAQLCSKGNITACHLAINLCALNGYSASDPSCKLLSSIYGDIIPNSLDNTHIMTTLSTKTNLPLVILMYSLDGSYLGLKNLTDDILLCKDLPSRTSSAWSVGTIYSIECSLSFDGYTLQFLELYFHEQASNTLYPVPVVITNYKDMLGSLVNEGSDSSKWQYVRRFYLWASVSSTFIYAQTMQLSFTFTADGKLYPYLRIAYNSTNYLKTSFSVLYTQDNNNFNIGLAVTAAILFGLSIVYSGILTNGYLRRTGRNFCEVPTFVYYGAELCSSASTVLFILLLTSSALWLIIYKAQTTLFFVLPLGSQELALKILIGVAFFCRLLHVVYVVVHQCSMDIFFIDWERPKGTAILPEATSTTTPTPATAAPVSIWRTLFVANEWNELQTVRKINPILLLVTVLLFLKVIGFEYLAEHEPYSHVTQSPDRYSPPYSSTLRFSLTALHFIIIAAVMRIYMLVIHERYIRHKIKDFIDLCSVSNISVLVLCSKLYGFYIHGRSVHGHAETAMREMLHNLHKEEEDLCGRRGLVTDSDIQTFELGLSIQFRTLYDNILYPLMAEKAAQNRTDANRSRGSDGVSEVSLKAHENMNQFLSLFIERNLAEVDYVIKDKSFIEKLLGIEFSNPVDRSFLYNDTSFSFDSMLFYGKEWMLLQLDILVFAVVDLVAQDYILAAIVTCAISLVTKQVRNSAGSRNLSQKALIDNRFLL